MSQWKFNPNDRSFASHVQFMYDGKIYSNMKELKEEYEFIKKPDSIPQSAVREGTYAIRERGYYQEVERYKEFWVKKGRWENDLMRSTWELFPRLSDREYHAINNIPFKMLSQEWQSNLRAYLHWVELRKIRRDVKKTFISL